jgi:hypothetical protein
MPNTRFQFNVSVLTDGSVSVDPNIPEDKKEDVAREANIIDIIDASRKLIADLERQLTMEMMNQVLEALSPKEAPTVSGAVKEALKERGITPEA